MVGLNFVLRKMLFLFSPETAHAIAHRMVRGLFYLPLTQRLSLRLLTGLGKKERLQLSQQPTQVGNHLFRNPIGLAAGFDKNGEWIELASAFGFGFIEVGSVTPRPQIGNSKPRLKRLVEKNALWNRMGFNNYGAVRIGARVREAVHSGKLPPYFRIGLNLGKQKDTPLEDAHKDYLESLPHFRELVDYVVINVSSPNTLGLRSLQTPDALEKIVRPVFDELSGWRNMPQLWVKLAPEIELAEFIKIEQRLRGQVFGWVLTNTLQLDGGGLSGQPLYEISRRRLNEFLQALPHLKIQSVGGLKDGKDAKERLAGGASLVQLYTGWIYNGAGYIFKLLSETQKSKKL